MSKEQIDSIPVDWHSSPKGRKTMDQYAAQHLACHNATKQESKFSKWADTSIKIATKRLMSEQLIATLIKKNYLSSESLRLLLSDMLAIAVRRYANYNRINDVKTHAQIKRRKSRYLALKSFVNAENKKHSDRWLNEIEATRLDELANLPSNPNLLERHHPKARRQAFILTLGCEMVKYFHHTDKLVCHTMCDLAALIDDPISPNSVKQQLKRIASKVNARRSLVATLVVSTLATARNYSWDTVYPSGKNRFLAPDESLVSQLPLTHNLDGTSWAPSFTVQRIAIILTRVNFDARSAC